VDRGGNPLAGRSILVRREGAFIPPAMTELEVTVDRQ
jgi:hypothetical protein